MELSVIIVSYNVIDYLRQSLLSVIAASEGISHEIIVVDNHSSDGSAEMVNNEFSDVRVIECAVNEGFSAACNKGIRESSGEFILILNPDTLVEPDAVTVALEFMRHHPEAGAAGARMTDGKGRFLPESKRGFPTPLASLFRFTRLCSLFPRSAFFNAYYLGHLSEDDVCRADILTGAFMMIRREAIEKTGPFDTDFFMYGEDIDLSWRIRQAGYVNYYLPGVRIIHYKGRSADGDRLNSLRHFYGSMKIFAAKHIGHHWQLPVKVCVTIMEIGAMTSMLIKRLLKNKLCFKKGSS